MENRKILIWVVVGVILVGGIAYIAWPEKSQGIVEAPMDDTQEPDMTEQVIVEASPTSGEPASDGVTESESSNSEGTAATDAPAPTPRQELVNTDPNTVNLASGDLQLVELFAFW